MKSNKFWVAVNKLLVAATVILILTLVSVPCAWAQMKYKTLHIFRGKDGAAPSGTLIFDGAGNIYGTTINGGTPGHGTVYELTPNGDGTWAESVLYAFTANENNGPDAGVVFDATGNLYGMTSGGPDAGDVYQLVPQPGGGWSENVLQRFWGAYDGNPQGGVTFDASGNLYGTGAWGCGEDGVSCVFEMTPNAGSWTFTQLYQLEGAKGWYPSGTTPIFDAKGNIYATTAFGGKGGCSPYGNGCYGLGVVFELSPNGDGTWAETLLHTFTGGKDGESPACPMVFDAAGNLYGTTFAGGKYGNGNVFRLVPNANGTWTEQVLHQFTGGTDGSMPDGGVTFDAAGNLYGVAMKGGAYGYGVVFQLSPTSSGGVRYRVVHAFQDTRSDPGAYPGGGPNVAGGTLVFDGLGNLYGTTSGDGSKTFGTVFEITP